MRTRAARIEDVSSARPPRGLSMAGYAVLAAAVLGVGLWWPERNESVSWHYFNTAAQSLFSNNGMHLFARHPELQFGPVATVAAEIGRLVGGTHTADLVAWLIAAAMIPMLMVVERVAVGFGAQPRRVRVTVLLGGLLLVWPWGELAFGTTHLDDAIALCATVLAMWAVVRRRPMVAAVLLAVAVDAKPWALAFVPLLVVFAGRERRAAFGTYIGLVLAAWLPFLLVDPKTFNAAKFTIANAAGSSLRWLGIRSASTPRWDRAAQIGFGGGVAGLAVLRRQWPSVLLAGVAVRMLLDPSTRLYYSAGLVLGAVVFDAAVAQWRVPWTAVITLTLTVIPGRYVNQVPASVQGGARFVGTVVPLLFVVWFARRSIATAPSEAVAEVPHAVLVG